MRRLSLHRLALVVWSLACTQCHVDGSVLEPKDAGVDVSIDTATHDANLDTGPASACVLLCEACGIAPCESHCTRDCADEATAAATCAAFRECIMDPAPDSGVEVPQPPDGVVMCGGRICAEGEECCFLTGECTVPGDPTCVVPPAETFPGACARNSDCPANEMCEAVALGAPIRGTCIGAVGMCFPRQDVNCDEAPEISDCGCDGRTYHSLCGPSRAGVRVSRAYRACGADIHANLRPTCRRAGEDACTTPPAAHQYCDPVAGRCASEQPLRACGIDAQCSPGERCCPFNGLCYDADRPASCGVADPGSVSCADEIDCQRWTGSYWDSGGEDGVFCDGPGSDGACGTSGQCRRIEVDCPDVTDPVCGCDGITYPSECHARMVPVRTAHVGACP